MSGFVAGGSAPSGEIRSDSFWPTIDLDRLRATLRIDSSVSTPRLETAAIAAVINVNRELAEWRATQQAAGYAKLADVPGDTVNDVSTLVHLYHRAVEASTGAEVCERYRSYDTTSAGSQNAEELTPSVDEYRRDQRWAIRDFLGRPRSTVELI
ncbi:head completion/stabilization protein [Pseudomonas sp. NPDC098747]|uniref:head completion/stabilization protein n=1 Tax=Pseudomonas sp. NPDC098747 TaxID=3364487 RepID=UPI00383B6F0E